jgi:hypothetical protein
MTALSNNMPGWFKRRRAGENDSGGAAETHSETAGASASVTTGGGSSQEPVVVWEAANVMEAQVVKARLESEGIPAFIRSEAAGVIYGLTAGSLARADVLVPGPLAEKAVDLLFGETEESPADEQP